MYAFAMTAALAIFGVPIICVHLRTRWLIAIVLPLVLYVLWQTFAELDGLTRYKATMAEEKKEAKETRLVFHQNEEIFIKVRADVFLGPQGQFFLGTRLGRVGGDVCEIEGIVDRVFRFSIQVTQPIGDTVQAGSSSGKAEAEYLDEMRKKGNVVEINLKIASFKSIKKLDDESFEVILADPVDMIVSKKA